MINSFWNAIEALSVIFDPLSKYPRAVNFLAGFLVVSLILYVLLPAIFYLWMIFWFLSFGFSLLFDESENAQQYEADSLTIQVLKDALKEWREVGRNKPRESTEYLEAKEKFDKLIVTHGVYLMSYVEGLEYRLREALQETSE